VGVGSPPPTDPPKGVSDDEVARLYHGPMESFTGERNALAKRLRSDGEKSASEWVKGLKKPSRAAWLVNQLPGRKAGLVKRLLETGEELRRQQERLIGGKPDRERMREAARREQETIDELLKCAAAIGQEHGVGSQILDRVGETLQAASADPDVARAVELGRLEREQRASGLGVVGAGVAAPARGPKAAKGEDSADAAVRRARQQEARRRRDAERRLAAAQKRLEREEMGLEKAREELGRREARVAEAQDELRSAREELDDR
jgi:hypothetical protein